MNSRVLLVFLQSMILCACKFTDDNTFYWRRSRDTKCEPFTAFMVACNRCVCSAEGTSYCTKVHCKSTEPQLSEELEFVSEMAKKRLEAEKTIF